MEDLEKSLQLAIAQLDRTYGKGTVVRLGDDLPTNTWPSISTSALNLDIALGIGGLPRGRIIEIYGPESSGKTTVALSTITAAQKDNLECAFIDVEHALDPQYARALGVNLEDLWIAQPDHGEQALDIVDTLVRSGAFGVIVIDSVAALVPKAELEGDMGQAHVGLQSRLMSQAMRKLVAISSNTNTMLIFINQIREKVGVMFGNPETTPGGRALKFYSSVRIDVRKREDLKDPKTGERRGVKIKANIVKNKMGPPYRTAEFDIVYGKGINTIGCILDLAVERGVVQKSGAWFAYNNENVGQGRDKAIEALASDLALAEQIKEEVLRNV